MDRLLHKFPAFSLVNAARASAGGVIVIDRQTPSRPVEPSSETRSSNFLRDIIARDVSVGTHGGRVALRFPPEPNGYPHLGHAKSICLNFGLAEEFGGTCNLRYDDTNPETESPEFVAALEDAVRWLGFSPAEIRFASDYFEQLYNWAVELIEKDLAYVDSQSEEEIRTNRGTVTEPGTPSRFRGRPAEESLSILDEMRRGLHPDGSHVVRAKIDMAHPNMKLRDPIMYRIRRDAHHYRRGADWKIYPLYDWAHGQGDAIENITHSVCTLEFDVNRPLYDWYLDALGIVEPRNHQYEFARLNLDYTVMSKRKLLRLVGEGHVAGWDDPRMPTIAGQRRRGVRPEAIRRFCDEIGVSKVDGRIELSRYEYTVRDDLSEVAPRAMAVTRPLRILIENLGEGDDAWIDAPYWPQDSAPPAGAPLSRRLPLSREIWIEQDDFSETPPKGWKRLSPGEEVRLRHSYVIKCTGVEKDDSGQVVAIRAQADLATLGAEPDGRKVRGVIHWVSAEQCVPATFRLYDRLFSDPAPDAAEDLAGSLNPESLVESNGFVETGVAESMDGTRFQFERLGFFWPDPVDSTAEGLVFNRIVALRDSWGKDATAAPDPSVRERQEASRVAGSDRDPAALLSEEQRALYDRLMSREVGMEEAAVIAADADLLSLLEAVVAEGAPASLAGVLIVHDVRPALGGRSPADTSISAGALAEVLRLLEADTLTKAGAREVVGVLIDEGGSAADVVALRGLAAVRDDAALLPVVDAVIADNPEPAARVRAGETKLIGFLMGQAMRRAPKGSDAARVKALLEERLAG
ncbi:glutamine--tRNA ligase/YqeY domain fusion protein [soil metagenome]